MNTCRMGFHIYGKWEDIGQLETLQNHLPTGRSFSVRNELVQKRHCVHCNRVQTRRIKL